MAINIEELKKREDLIKSQKHPKLDLIIWNYKDKCAYEKVWDKYTKMCRGLITDLEGNIIARPFPKFFNLGEPESELKDLPSEVPSITEKMDGSLGIQYYDGNNVCIATRGSFNSEQSQWATEWIQRKFSKADFLEGHTYLYEIVYPNNRIVINYGDRKELILLAVINIEDGSELNIEDEAKRLGLNYPKIYDFNVAHIITLLPTLSGNEEGFVVKYPTNNFRVKMKGEEYVRLHRIITGLNTKHIWEYLMLGQSLDEFLEAVPDEFYNWVNNNVQKMTEEYNQIMNEAKESATYSERFETKKEKAEFVFKNHKKIFSVIFGLIDGKMDKAKERAWRLVKPVSAIPFKQQEYDSNG